MGLFAGWHFCVPSKECPEVLTVDELRDLLVGLSISIIQSSPVVPTQVDLDWFHNLIPWVNHNNFREMENEKITEVLRLRMESICTARVMEKYPGPNAESMILQRCWLWVRKREQEKAEPKLKKRERFDKYEKKYFCECTMCWLVAFHFNSWQHGSLSGRWGIFNDVVERCDALLKFLAESREGENVRTYKGGSVDFELRGHRTLRAGFVLMALMVNCGEYGCWKDRERERKRGHV